MYQVVRELFTSKKHKYGLLAPEDEDRHSWKSRHRTRSVIMLATLLALLVAASVVTAWPWPHAWGHSPCNTIEAGYQCRPELSHYWGELYSPKALGQTDADDITKVNTRRTLKSSLKFQTYCQSNVISPLPKFCLVMEPEIQPVSFDEKAVDSCLSVFGSLKDRTLQRHYFKDPRKCPELHRRICIC